MKTKKTFASILLTLCLILMCSISTLAAFKPTWKTTEGGVRYYTEKKVYVVDQWYKIDGHYFHFDELGFRQDGRIKVKSKYYYCDPKTGRVTNDKRGQYFYNSKGVMVKSQWVKAKNGKTYYCSDNGKIYYREFEVDGKKYSQTKTGGKVLAKWYKGHYYDKSGVLMTKCWIGDSYVNKNGDITKGVKDPVNPSDSDVRLLAALVYYEAGNQSYYGKQCVASVVLNRMKSKTFPNKLRDVIYQPGQFTPAGNGCVSSLYNSKQSIQSDCVWAARTVLTEGTKLAGYYFFNNFSGEKKIGDHYFSKVYR